MSDVLFTGGDVGFCKLPLFPPSSTSRPPSTVLRAEEDTFRNLANKEITRQTEAASNSQPAE